MLGAQTPVWQLRLKHELRFVHELHSESTQCLGGLSCSGKSVQNPETASGSLIRMMTLSPVCRPVWRSGFSANY